MIIDLKWSMGVFCGPEPAGIRLTSQGEFSMSWVNDESNQAVKEDELKASRERAYEQQMWGLWDTLKRQIVVDVQSINDAEYLVKNRLGGEKLRIEDGEDFRVIKITYPAVYLTLKNRHRYIEVDQNIVTNGQNRQSRNESENIDIEVDENYRLYFRTAKRESLTVVEVSQRVLTPMVRIQGLV
jgi:hypothetical protein